MWNKLNPFQRIVLAIVFLIVVGEISRRIDELYPRKVNIDNYVKGITTKGVTDVIDFKRSPPLKKSFPVGTEQVYIYVFLKTNEEVWLAYDWYKEIENDRILICTTQTFRRADFYSNCPTLAKEAKAGEKYLVVVRDEFGKSLAPIRFEFK